MVDIATRVYNHKWKIDPIIRSLIDTDFYKLLMCQSIFRNRPDTVVRFKLINRSSDIRLAELIDEGELREQLDHVRGLSLSRGESTWMRGNTFYGKRQMFRPDFMAFLEGLRLPAYQLEKRDGQYELTFEGKWAEVMLWEIPALAILMELRSRAVLETLGRFELQVLYARAMTRLWEKIEALRKFPDLRIADFGTRRRHSFLWQDWAVQAMIEGLGERFTGTSNCLIAMRRDIEAIGTNAHELPMVYAALAETDAELHRAPYEVLADWQEEHDGMLRMILPDTYGTDNFLEHAPDWLAGWTGIRIDSGDPAEGAEAAIRWWRERGEDPRDKLVIFSDGLDVEKIIELHRRFHGRVKVSFGWGTLLTNDFRGLVPGDGLAPFSLVCKAVAANGRPTVKLSDNPAKAMGPGTRSNAISACSASESRSGKRSWSDQTPITHSTSQQQVAPISAVTGTVTSHATLMVTTWLRRTRVRRRTSSAGRRLRDRFLRRSSHSRAKPTPKTPPTATWVDETGRPRPVAPSTISAVASVMQKARTAFSRVIPLPTMTTRRRPNSTAPRAIAVPAPTSSNSGTPTTPEIAAPSVARRIISNGPATLLASLAPCAKAIITAENSSAGRNRLVMRGLSGESCNMTSTRLRMAQPAANPANAPGSRSSHSGKPGVISVNR